MDNKCPKCGRKLSFFYVKENCPDCGANIMYYNMEKRLEEDSIKAEAEFEKFNALVDKITPKFVKKMMNKNKENEEAEKSVEESAENQE